MIPQLQFKLPQLKHAVILFIHSFAALSLLGMLAMVTGSPFVFPSLGPTGFLLVYDPNAQASRPRNVLGGHAIGILCGWLSLWVTGLSDRGSVMETGMIAARVIAAALSYASTGLVMTTLRAQHAPAVATTLIVALGFITTLYNLVIMELSVGLMIVCVFVSRKLGSEFIK